jgi:hypothetical protein
MAKNVTCKYRITATVKADTKYELEVTKENLISRGKHPSHRPHHDRSGRASRTTQTCSLTSKARELAFAPNIDVRTPRLGPFLLLKERYSRTSSRVKDKDQYNSC